MFLLVIPTSHSIGTTPLTYILPEEFRGSVVVGCLVEIPVGRYVEYGIVTAIIDTVSDPEMLLKPIIRIITSKPVLAPYQISIILSIAARYLIPIHRVLGFFLIRPVLNRLEKKGFPIGDNEELPDIQE